MDELIDDLDELPKEMFRSSSKPEDLLEVTMDELRAQARHNPKALSLNTGAISERMIQSVSTTSIRPWKDLEIKLG